MQKIKEFWNECVRVLKITKKPNKEEFITVARAAGLGILIIGAIGFIVYLISIPLRGVFS
jgi:protein transport protein SEC61 subunit gamma-like protein